MGLVISCDFIAERAPEKALSTCRSLPKAQGRGVLESLVGWEEPVRGLSGEVVGEVRPVELPERGAQAAERRTVREPRELRVEGRERGRDVGLVEEVRGHRDGAREVPDLMGRVRGDEEELAFLEDEVDPPRAREALRVGRVRLERGERREAPDLLLLVPLVREEVLKLVLDCLSAGGRISFQRSVFGSISEELRSETPRSTKNLECSGSTKNVDLSTNHVVRFSKREEKSNQQRSSRSSRSTNEELSM